MRILMVSYPSMGHFNPTQPVVIELIRRRHEVVWMSGSDYETKITETGAKFIPMADDTLLDHADLDSIAYDTTLGPLTKLTVIMRKVFIDCVPAQVLNYQSVLNDFPADIIVIDWRALGARTLYDLTGLPFATIGIMPLLSPQPDIPPFGTGWQPPKTFLGRWRNSLCHWIGNAMVASKLFEELNKKRREFGLDPLPRGLVFDDYLRSDLLHLMTSTLSLEFPRRNLSSAVKFIGPLLPRINDKDWVLPEWWDEMVSHPRETIIHVTQGTIAKDSGKLIKPALEALKSIPGLLIILTLTAEDAKVAFPPDELDKIPENVRIAQFIPHTKLLPHVGVMVTNAGFGGVLAAMSYGVPLICAGRSEDKTEVSARVAWSGAGIDLGTDTPTVSAIRAAVLKVLTQKRYREAAQRVEADFATHNGAVEAADELEHMFRKIKLHPEVDVASESH
jgi:UDP:flavonoid glycosyltransferase YjiC (YdhE family)